jgi:hypothetical protein
MKPIRFLLLGAVLAAYLAFPCPAFAEEPYSVPEGFEDPPPALTASSSQARRITLGALSMQVGIGAMVFSGDYDELHLACGAIITQGLLAGKYLSLNTDYEVWATANLSGDVEVRTVPILLGLRGEIFPASPVRLYGSAGAGLCIVEVTSYSDWEIVIPWLPIPSREINEGVSALFAYAVGGGLEMGGIRSNKLFSIDYRYVVAGLGSIHGGHLLCVSYGIQF